MSTAKRVTKFLPLLLCPLLYADEPSGSGANNSTDWHKDARMGGYAIHFLGNAFGLLDGLNASDTFGNESAIQPAPPRLNRHAPRTRWDLEDYKVDGSGRMQRRKVKGIRVPTIGELFGGANDGGADPFQFDISATAGHDGNFYGSPDHSYDSSYYGVDFLLKYQATDEWRIAAGASVRQFEHASWSRQGGSDDFITNFFFNSSYFRQLTDTLYFSHEVSLVHGGLGSLHHNDLVRGILERDRTYITTDANLYYRRDGRKLTDPGYFTNLSYATTHYNQSRESGYDVDDGTLGLGITRVINPRLSIFAGIEHRERVWHNDDFNSDGFRYFAGVSGEFPCGVDYDFSLNHEDRNYKNPIFRDRDQLGYDLTISGEINDRTRWGLRSSYGFQDPNIGLNRDNNLIDAHGNLFGAYVSHKFGNGYLATLFCTALFLEAHVFNSFDLETQHVINGLRIDKRIDDRTDASFTLGHQKVEYEFANTSRRESSFYTGLSVRRRF